MILYKKFNVYDFKVIALLSDFTIWTISINFEISKNYTNYWFHINFIFEMKIFEMISRIVSRKKFLQTWEEMIIRRRADTSSREKVEICIH